ncbi:MAG: hypothetical protein HY805_02150 [Nitrospirae bacterium]|nr:hypothetical protein [Nitrospirota bacterium]
MKTNRAIQIADYLKKKYPELINFFSAYSHDAIVRGIEFCFMKDYPQGIVSDVPLAQNINELDRDAREFLSVGEQ